MERDELNEQYNHKAKKKYNLSETLQVQRVDNFVSDNRSYEKNLKIRVQLVTGDLMNG